MSNGPRPCQGAGEGWQRVPVLAGFETSSSCFGRGPTQPLQEEKTNAGPALLQFGALHLMFPVANLQANIYHLAAPSAGQQSELFGCATRRARTTLTFPPRAPPSTLWHAAPPAAWRTPQRARWLLNSAGELSKHWNLSPTRDISNSLKLLCVFQSRFPFGVLLFLSLPRSFYT